MVNDLAASKLPHGALQVLDPIGFALNHPARRFFPLHHRLGADLLGAMVDKRMGGVVLVSA
jgi:hypothetical protein